MGVDYELFIQGVSTNVPQIHVYKAQTDEWSFQ